LSQWEKTILEKITDYKALRRIFNDISNIVSVDSGRSLHDVSYFEYKPFSVDTPIMYVLKNSEVHYYKEIPYYGYAFSHTAHLIKDSIHDLENAVKELIGDKKAIVRSIFVNPEGKYLFIQLASIDYKNQHYRSLRLWYYFDVGDLW